MIGGAFVVPVMAQQATNQVPVAQPDTVSTAEETAITVAVLANDTDPDGNALTVTGFVSPTHGTAVINGAATVTYTPAANYVGVDTFAYTVSDGQGGTAVGTVIITVTAANDVPVAVGDTVTASAGATSIAVLTNDTDPDGDTLTITAVTQGAHGTVGSSAGGVVTYTPTVGYSGQDVFTYTVSDGHGGTATGTVTVTVSAVAVNRAPVAVGDTLSAQQDMSKVISVLANDTDPDGDTLAVATATPAAHGTVAVNANGTVTYTPVAGYVGQDIFTYTARDAGGLTAVGTVTVTVTATVVVPPPAPNGDKDLCKDYLWKLLGFKNQGQCIAAANQMSHEGDGDEFNIALVLALLSDRQLTGGNVRNILNGQVTVLMMKPIVVIQPVIVQQVVTVRPPVIANGGNNNQAVISYLEKSRADEKVNAMLQAKAEAKAKAEAQQRSSKKH